MYVIWMILSHNSHIITFSCRTFCCQMDVVNNNNKMKKKKKERYIKYLQNFPPKSSRCRHLQQYMYISTYIYICMMSIMKSIIIKRMNRYIILLLFFCLSRRATFTNFIIYAYIVAIGYAARFGAYTTTVVSWSALTDEA